MKFLCGNCKAKYQIADEKVAGRTLRMKCRRCGHDILIHGEGNGAPVAERVAGSTVSLPPKPARRMPPPAVGAPPAPPSALGAGFRRGMAAPPEMPRRQPAALDQWHVAINDVPVGPMSREELGRKIQAGAVGPRSLCWREGMDDWRPVEEVGELSMLLERGGAAVPPLRPAHGAVGSPSSMPLDDFEEDQGEPTRVADSREIFRGVGSGVSSQPISVPPPAPSAPSQPVSLPSQSVVAAPPSIAGEAVAPAGRTQMSPWALIGVGMALAMGLLGGPFIVMRLLESPAPPAQAAVAPTPAPSPQSKTPALPELEIEEPEEEPEVVEAPQEKHADKPAARKPARRATASSAKSSSGGSGKQLSAEEQALLDRMGGGGAAPSSLTRRSSSDSVGGGGGESLSAAQLRAVVQKNRPGLQRCYESALRSTGSSDTVKVTIEVTVGMSGTVTRANASGGASISGLDRCIERTVKRWRFPSASGSTQTAFPVVFQPGA